MKNQRLRMSTAIAACLSISVPVPVLAQEAEPVFPCVTPDGSEVENVDALSAALLEYLEAGVQSENFGTCDPIALQDAFDADEDLRAAFSTAPIVLQDQLLAVNPALLLADVPEVAAEDGVELQAAPEAEVEAEVEAEAVIENELPQVEETEPEIVAGAEAPEIENETVEPEAELLEENTDQALVETPADPAILVDDAATIGAGEAGGEQLTDKERQALNQERQDETVSAAAAADAEGIDQEQAEVETQTIEEADVRSASEDFSTAAVGDVQTSASDNNNGTSNFERALLLGLGAAVVGTLLNNGDKVVSNSGDRIIVERDGELRVLKNDDELLRRPGAQVQTQTFGDGSTRSVVFYEDGSQIITVRSSDGTVLRRTLVRAEDGSEFVLFDDTQAIEPIAFDELPNVAPVSVNQAIDTTDQDALTRALEAALVADLDRSFSLQQIRDFKRVRNLAPEVELDQITFASGSAAIQPGQAEELRALGLSMINIIDDNPRAVFLVEGHTDAVGNAGYNLSLSDRRAETVALALTEYFGVPPQNLVTQGYGETDLKVPVLTDERANRRASVRNITRLLNVY